MSKTYNVSAVLRYASGALGKPYRWAAAGPNAYDCSGLTMRAFAAGGYPMPHNSMAQYLQTIRTKLPKTDAPPAGCLVFFGTAGVVHHVGISIGGGQGIFAPHTGANVEKESIAAVRSGFTFYAVTNPLGATDTSSLSPGEDQYAKAAGRGNVPPLLGLFLAALRWQESGSPAGNYSEPNGQGAYQIIPSSWTAATRRYGIGQQYPTASSAPRGIQDDIAAARVTDIYYGAGEKSWRVTARVWNGGTPNSVPNPALGPGATTNTYATEVLAKMGKINPAQLASSAAASTADTGTGGCVHELTLNLHITSAHLCMDKVVAIIAIQSGGLLMLGGVAVLLYATAGQSKLLSQVSNAIPAGRALNIAKAAGPRARAERAQTAEAGEARRLAPVRTAERAAAAETRREQAHSQRLRHTETRNRRAGRAAASRERNMTEAHYDRMEASSARRARASVGRPTGRSIPGGRDAGSHTTTRSRPAATLPDVPPF